MPAILSALACGLLFGLGLIVSQMVNPAKVLGFFDILGNWDPSLALVMAGAIAVSAAGYAIANRQVMSVFAPELAIPMRRDLEPRLFAGAAIFGVGWGLAGFCPGPALTALTLDSWQVPVFVAAMLAGMALFRVVPLDWPRTSFRRSS